MNSWHIQLQNINIETLAQKPVDLFIIDPFDYDTGENEPPCRPHTSSDIQTLKGEQNRTVLGYISVGEAEAYRAYWDSDWEEGRSVPPWLDRENLNWAQNYKVKYWDRNWKKILQAQIDHLLNVGYDGAFLDTADSFEFWKGTRPSAEHDMVRLIIELAQYARKTNPNFNIFPNNAHHLMYDAALRQTVSGAVTEDLLFGQVRYGAPNPSDGIGRTRAELENIRQQSKPVLVIEYDLEEDVQVAADKKLRTWGFVPCFAARALDGE